MAPSAVARGNKETRINDLLKFATDLPQRIQSDQVDPNLLSDIQQQIGETARISLSGPSSRYADFDQTGTSLYNLSTRLKRCEDGHVNEKLICHVRAFAFSLVDAAQQASRGSIENSIRVLKAALKTAKLCLAESELDLCTRVLESAARYEKKLSGPESQVASRDAILQKDLSAEYFLLRTALAAKQSRLDVAELMWTKVCPPGAKLDLAVGEQLADVLYKLGCDLLRKKQYESSLKWLQRAYDVLLAQDIDLLSADAAELRMSILQRIVRSLIGSGKDGDLIKAMDFLALLENDFGDRMMILVLKMELLACTPPLNVSEYFVVLQRALRIPDLTELNFKILLRRIHILDEKSTELACKALDELLNLRLLSSERQEWIEKVLITRIWMTAKRPDNTDAAGVRNLLEAISSCLSDSLSVDATHAAQILLWKKIDSHYAQDQFEIAEIWCQIALHPMFHKAGELNQAKISRKLILCALARQNTVSAREVYERMTTSGKDAPMTKYLMFKVAMRSADIEYANECLEAVCKDTAKDHQLVYACVVEAQQSGNKALAAAALQKVLDKYETEVPDEVHIPALLRCAARLLMSELNNVVSENEQAIGRLCKLYEAAAAQAEIYRRHHQGKGKLFFSTAELDWFSKNCYNLALKHCTDWAPEFTLRLVESCVKLIDLYPQDLEEAKLADLSLRRMFCSFLCASLHVVLARPEDNIEKQLQWYLGLRFHVNEFRKPLQEHLERLDGCAKDDLKNKQAALLAFDFEAAVRLKNWDCLEDAVEECSTCGNIRLYETLADIILCSKAPSSVIISTLRKIVNLTFIIEGINIAKLSRWVRCLFQLALPTDIGVAEQLLDEFVSIVGSSLLAPQVYPPEEIEWLATTVFNRAVDFYCASDDASCRRWSEKALAIADLGEHNDAENGHGSLRETLRGKYLSLSLGE